MFQLNEETACLPRVCKFGERLDTFAEKEKTRKKKAKAEGDDSKSNKKGSSKSCVSPI